jgi:hypothetical protein
VGGVPETDAVQWLKGISGVPLWGLMKWIAVA